MVSYRNDPNRPRKPPNGGWTSPVRSASAPGSAGVGAPGRGEPGSLPGPQLERVVGNVGLGPAPLERVPDLGAGNGLRGVEPLLFREVDDSRCPEGCGGLDVDRPGRFGACLDRLECDRSAVDGLEIDAFSRERMDATLSELQEERSGVASLLA